MSLIPASAFAFLRDKRVTVHAERVGEDGVRERAALTVAASVSGEGATPDALGAEIDAQGVTVEIAASDWTAPVPITPGSWIDQDPDGRWRRLTVQTVTRVGEMLHLVCSAKEGGQKRG